MQLLKYEDFKAELIGGIKRCIPEKYKGYSIEMHRIPKNSQTLDGICIHDRSASKAVSPVIYADDFYKKYTDGEKLDAVIDNAATLLFGYFENMDIDITNPEENIVPVLMNRNALPPNAVHIPFLDIEIAFKWIMANNENGVYGTLVTEEIARAFSINKDTLLDKAKANMKRLMPISVAPLKDFIPDADTGSIPAYIITSKDGTDGTAYILHDEVLKVLKDIFKTDFYILMPCTHEALVIHQDFMSFDSIKQFLSYVKTNLNLDKDEQLSDSIYKYSDRIEVVK